ncbi:hypothetical protein V6N13_006096 [Hibiscus sabdariffa]|uniref:Uncharacterized protein n=1 Tax=Hibiscus sabdariffa TaxID=183260 RepID=A0ABR2ENT5_9ROSI
MLLVDLVPGNSSKSVKVTGPSINVLEQEIEPGAVAGLKHNAHCLPPDGDGQINVAAITDVGGIKPVDLRKSIGSPAAPRALHVGTVPQASKPVHREPDSLSEGVVRKIASSHRRKSVTPTEGSNVDVDEVARSNKRSRLGKQRSSSSTKCSRSGNDLVDDTKEKDAGLDMAEAVEQPRPEH